MVSWQVEKINKVLDRLQKDVKHIVLVRASELRECGCTEKDIRQLLLGEFTDYIQLILKEGN